MSRELIFEQVKTVSAAVLASEGEIDDSLAATARMIAQALDAHRAVGIPAHVVQPALDHMGEAFLGQLESRRQIALAHLEFGRTAARLGATPEAYGDWWPCPQFPSKPATDTVRPLAVVA
jgi:hypothetical protein